MKKFVVCSLALASVVFFVSANQSDDIGVAFVSFVAGLFFLFAASDQLRRS